jgi:2-(1,2-epoxy-1,2-dihydrophenyl)acetyl-CoA isomerase
MTTLRASEDGGVLRITFARPERANALAPETGQDLAKAIGGIGPGTRCVLLLADGPNFCVGGDVSGFAAAADVGEHVRALADSIHAILVSLHATGLPVVVGARGWAAGAGMSLVLLGDVVVLGESARLRPGYGGIGITPDCGMTWTLPRAVGAARARDILFTNRAVGAQEALAIGIASRVVPDDDVDATAAAVAAELAAAATGALRATRDLLEAGASRGFAEHLDAEAASIAARAASAEGREGIAAFVAKRPPRFAGA